MPCFDKKLEASRSDFYLNEAETREVDCVITSGTVTTLMMLFVFYEYGVHSLIYTSHCFIQERSRKCWRRKMFLWAMWNLHPLMNCKLCDILSLLNLLRKSPGIHFQNGLRDCILFLIQVQQCEWGWVPEPCWERVRGLPPSRVHLCCQAAVWRGGEGAHLQDPQVSVSGSFKGTVYSKILLPVVLCIHLECWCELPGFKSIGMSVFSRG